MTVLSPSRCVNGMMSSFPGNTNKTTVLLDSGNYPSYSNYLNSTYVFPVSGGTPNWSLVSASSVDPLGPLPCRVDAVMAFDGYNVMLYGGREGSSTGGVLQDTWVYGPATTATWSQLSPATVPFGRYKSEGAYLAGTGVVMFGGEIVGQLVDETWVWNGNTQAWSQVTSTNSATTWPSARTGHCMAASASQVLLFGGRGNNSQKNDTWSFASGAWTLLTPTASPSVRSEACMVYDSHNSVWVLFGGQNEYDYLNETWTFNGTTWTQVTGTMPSGRVGAQMAFDTTLNKTVLFGGQNATTNYPANDTWLFDGSALTWVQA